MKKNCRTLKFVIFHLIAGNLNIITWKSGQHMYEEGDHIYIRNIRCSKYEKGSSSENQYTIDELCEVIVGYI